MNLDELTASENASIAAFLTRHSDRLRGNVLDFGSGRSPYRRIVEVEGGGNYVPYDRIDHPCSMATTSVGPDNPLELPRWDAIICTQVVQFIPDVAGLLEGFREALRPSGALLLTYPTCWPEVNEEDLRRFTRSGMERLLRGAAFQVYAHELRGSFALDGFELAFGYGVVAV